jgi:hypothetical protein
LGPLILHQTQKRIKIRIRFVIDFAPIISYVATGNANGKAPVEKMLAGLEIDFW